MDIWNYILLILIALFVGFASIFLFMGCKIWKILIIILIISILGSFLILCALNFLSGYGISIPWTTNSKWHEILTGEMILVSLVIGGVITFLIMLGILITRNID